MFEDYVSLTTYILNWIFKKNKENMSYQKRNKNLKKCTQKDFFRRRR